MKNASFISTKYLIYITHSHSDYLLTSINLHTNNLKKDTQYDKNQAWNVMRAYAQVSNDVCARRCQTVHELPAGKKNMARLVLCYFYPLVWFIILWFLRRRYKHKK